MTEVEGYGLVFSEPKTNERRSVTLPKFLRDELGAHLAGRAAEPDHFVFPASSGGVLRHKMFYKRVFKPAVASAGLPESLRFHDLRVRHEAPCTGRDERTRLRPVAAGRSKLRAA